MSSASRKVGEEERREEDSGAEGVDRKWRASVAYKDEELEELRVKRGRWIR